jgi:hypothetical protein
LFPENTASGLPRASAVVILDDHTTGCPFACPEASVISATRTAASALDPEKEFDTGDPGTGEPAAPV